MTQERLVTHSGGCHCGRVRFEVRAPAKLQVLDCNCSICTQSGYLHLVVPQDRFKLLQGEDALSVYTFNTHTAKHLFCSTCGVKSFYIPRNDPGSRSVNARCLDPGTALGMAVSPFNGREWGRRRYTP
ncbi:MAG TPA: GFA family protein [Burkholderiales bacterium]|jgi:hypothetical protein|nr:GFA family protein [Burkholderiales bacterium]